MVKPPNGFHVDGSMYDCTIFIRTWFEKSESPAPLELRSGASSEFTGAHWPRAGTAPQRVHVNDKMTRKKVYSFMVLYI
jgi:hypothetical protein